MSRIAVPGERGQAGAMRVALVTVLALACSRERAKAPEPPPAKPRVVAISYAAFEGNELLACFDVSAEIAPSAKVDEEKLRRVVEPHVDASSGQFMQLRRPCRDQFSDRPTLAACSGSEEKGPVRFLQTTSYYSFRAAFADDFEMKDCLKRGMDWKAVPRDSNEFVQAKLSYDAERAAKNYDEAKKDMDRAMRAFR